MAVSIPKVVRESAHQEYTASPPRNGGVKQFITAIWLPFCALCAVFSVLSAPFVLGLQPLKTFVLFGLCGVVVFSLFMAVQKSNRTILDRVAHWSILALVANTFYLNIFHAMVTK
jgi:hypothetical protein